MDFLKPDTDLYNVPYAIDSFNDMPYRRLGDSGLLCSNVGLGTWKMGYPGTGVSVMEKLKKLKAIADEKGAQLSQLVLAYMLSLPGMGPVIPAVSSAEQLTSNAEAGKLLLDENCKKTIRDLLAS